MADAIQNSEVGQILSLIRSSSLAGIVAQDAELPDTEVTESGASELVFAEFLMQHGHPVAHPTDALSVADTPNIETNEPAPRDTTPTAQPALMLSSNASFFAVSSNENTNSLDPQPLSEPTTQTLIEITSGLAKSSPERIRRDFAILDQIQH